LNNYHYREHIKNIYERSLFSDSKAVADDDIQLIYIRQYLPADPNIFILDAGCGNGKYATKLKEMGYRNIFAVDLFDNIGRNGDYNYQKASIDNLPFKDGVFDFIYSNSVIYYLKNPEVGIQEFSRVLKKNGILLFTSHTKYSLFTVWRRIKLVCGLHNAIHLKGATFLSTGKYKKFLENQNFKILHVDGYRLSIFFYPLYVRFSNLLNKKSEISFPLLKAKVSQSILTSRLKSIMAYHFIISAKKQK